MKVSIQTLGSLGDVMPYISIAESLKTRGHTVSILAPRDYTELITSHGITAAPPPPFSLDKWMVEAEQRGTLTNPVSFFRDWKRMITPHVDQTMARSLEAADGADLVLANLICAPARVAAEYHKLPFILSAQQPTLTPTKHVPCVMMARREMDGMRNRLSYGAMKASLWLVGRALAPHRKKLGLPRTPAFTDISTHLGRALTQITSVSPILMHQRPGDWPGHAHLVAYPSKLPSPDWIPPPALQSFLEAGSAPIFIGLGSMQLDAARPFLELAIEGLEQAGLRGLFAEKLVRGTGLDLGQHGVIEHAPHDQLLPLCAAIVHHGGAGTIDTAMRAGCPQIIMPQMLDQFWHGRRLEHLGLAP
ncbi:MAG: glycosyltransferase, partial [Hyphomonadaceae bacterium]